MLLAVALTLALSEPVAPDDGPASIEELLERYSELRNSSLEAMSTDVSLLLKELMGHIEGDRMKSVVEVRGRLLGLGSETAPLLLSALDPGLGHGDAELELSRQVAFVLQDLSLGSIHEPLIQMASTGSISGRQLAVHVLGFSDDAALVGPALRAIYASEVRFVDLAILEALARLGDEEDLSFVADRLTSEVSKEVNDALTAFARVRVSEASDAVLSLAADTPTAANHADLLCDWYRACPDAFNDEHCEAVLNLVKYSRLSSELRIELLKVLSAHEREWPSGTKKALREMVKRADPEFRREVLIVLTLAGDGNARRDLIEPLESSLNESFFTSDRLTKLAHVYYRIQEYRDAIKYYRRAFADGLYSVSDRRAVYLGLARCYAKEKKYKDAEEWLGKVPISRDELAKLALDPDFVQMASSKRYRKAFGID